MPSGEDRHSKSHKASSHGHSSHGHSSHETNRPGASSSEATSPKTSSSETDPTETTSPKTESSVTTTPSTLRPSMHIETVENVAIVTIDTPGEKVNKLGESMIGQFEELIERLHNDPKLHGAFILSGKKDTFIAGADIDLFQTRTTAAELEALSLTGHRMMNQIAESPKPVVVGIHGACMGGGTELALACHYRIITYHKSTAIGLPEVQLGLLPGMGGTQRLPRLIGIQKALTYMLTGKKMYARQAKKNGFADEVVYAHGLMAAGLRAVHRLYRESGNGKGASSKPINKSINKTHHQTTAKPLAPNSQPHPHPHPYPHPHPQPHPQPQPHHQPHHQPIQVTRKDRRSLAEKLLESTAAGRAILFRQALKQTISKTAGNYPAPPLIIESVKYGYKHGLQEGLRHEAKRFGELAVTPQSRALVQLFFAMTAARKNPLPENVRSVKSIGVLGAGLMGSGIAEVTAKKGVHVWLKDRTIEQAFHGKKRVEEDLRTSQKRRIITAFEADQIRSHIHPSASYDGFKQIGLVIEAVFEDLQLKKNILKEVEAACTDETIFATNTSSLPVSEIAAEAARPELVVGMHYFSPVQKMPLLEIIKTDKTADWVTATACEIGLKQGKHIIVVNDGPGFYTTRILAPFMNEALLLLEEGARIGQIDHAMKQFGFPVGPVTLFDEVGIDVGAHVADVLGPTFRARGAKTSGKAKELLDAGFMGRKNGRGFYVYGDAEPLKNGKARKNNGKAPKNSGKKRGKKQENEAVYSFFQRVDANKTRETRSTTIHTREEIQDRLSLMMINEALYCLQEGILQSPTDGDLGAVLGLGFPPFLGGPFRYIDRTGPKTILQKMDALAEGRRSSSGPSPRFRAAQILRDYVADGKTFHG